jgi:hypothetical protein
MKLSERLTVLIQATTLSQKSGILTLDDAVKAKTAIDIISSGTLNQKFTTAINVLIEIVVLSQKKGIYSLKDAYMIYLAIEGIENELKNEIVKLSGGVIREEVIDKTETKNIHNDVNNQSEETIITVPPKILKNNR